MLDDLFEFLQGAVTPYHAAAIAAAWLDAAGYTRLEEADYWNLEAGKGYYITRNGSSVIAWRVPEHAIGGWRIAASHSDSPCWKIKNEKVENDGCSRLSVEGYGGMIMSTWLDRPLTVAGRVMVKTEDGIESRLINIDEDLLVIPSLAIHMQRNVNKGKEFNPQIDMQPLWGPAGCRTLTDVLCEELNVQSEDILDRDLQLVTRQQPTRIGPDGEYLLAPRIDATTLLAFLDAAPDCDSACAPVWAMFDNEEVGSSSRMGAESSYLRDVLDRIIDSIPHSAQAKQQAMANSYMLSADNAHAVHPNHPEHTDVNNCTYMNKGVVIKTHAGQKYTSDGMSVAAARELAARAGVPLQYFANRSDKVGGSTLGNLAMAQVSMNCVDIGLPQLAMHSCYETAGAEDTLSLIKLMQELYSSHFEETAFGTLSISK